MNEEVEIWKPVVGYEGLYEVSSMGNVNRVSLYGLPISSRRLKTSTHRKGYLVVALTKDNFTKSVKVHRIVCAAFHPNPENKPQVNHRDGNKNNNNEKNLEWCTQLENQAHAVRYGLKKTPNKGKFGAAHHGSKKTIAINIATGEERLFAAISDIVRELKIPHNSIGKVKKGEWKHSHGWTFKNA